MTKRERKIKEITEQTEKAKRKMSERKLSETQFYSLDFIVAKNIIMLESLAKMTDEEYDKGYVFGTVKTKKDFLDWLGVKINRPFLLDGNPAVVYYDESECMLLIDGMKPFPDGEDVLSLINSRIAQIDELTVEDAYKLFENAMSYEKSRLEILEFISNLHKRKKGNTMFKNRKDKAHLAVSLVKSALRIAGGASAVNGDIVLCGYLLIVAEVLGIVEELVV